MVAPFAANSGFFVTIYPIIANNRKKINKKRRDLKLIFNFMLTRKRLQFGLKRLSNPRGLQTAPCTVGILNDSIPFPEQ